MFIDMNNSHDCLMSVWSLSDVSMTIITHVIAQKIEEQVIAGNLTFYCSCWQLKTTCTVYTV